MEIPYTVEKREDTGFYNSQFGIWLFISSEVMLFGGLFSAFILFAVSNPAWPYGEKLDIMFGSVNTAILLVSTLTMFLAQKAIGKDNFSGFRVWWIVTILLGVAFIVLKMFEYNHHFHVNDFPSKNNFIGMYFVITGAHVLHVLGGLVVNAYHIGPGTKFWKSKPGQYKNRIEVSGIYWYFVDLLWLFVLFPVLYIFS